MPAETILQYCPHSDRPPAARMCPHVIEEDYVQIYSGEGLFYTLICMECEKLLANEISLEDVCASCLSAFEKKRSWGPERLVGTPQIFDRPSDLNFVHEVVAITWPSNSAIMELQPINSQTNILCLALTDAGHLWRVNFTAGDAQVLAQLPSGKLDFTEKLTLVVSTDGRWAAIANTNGQHGLVIDVTSGNVTMALERDNYYIEHSQFPLAFFQYQQQTLLVHGTVWNRLDISDPQTGALLTERGPTNYKKGEEQPEHYLDYFHSSLLVSPNQEWIVDNGWFWHPMGSVITWSLKNWLSGNVWESEDGATLQILCQREYLWDGAICWIDNTTLCVWGIGKDDAQMLPGVRLFDVTTGEELHSFAGPYNALEFDEYLFSHSPEHGTSFWDITTGERLLQDGLLNPSCYHRGARQFVTLLSDGAVRLSRLQGQTA